MILDNVKRLAQERGLSICELEKQAGLSNGSIGKWDIANPTVESVRRVAMALGVSLMDILEGFA